jgi:hypothetical protein
MSKAYNNLANKDIYETFDYAEFLKNNEKFKESFITTPKLIMKLKKTSFISESLMEEALLMKE